MQTHHGVITIKELIQVKIIKWCWRSGKTL